MRDCIPPFRNTWMLASAALALSFTGCNSTQPEYVPVTGTVTLDGKPLTKGNVLTQPSAGRGANALIQPDGTFTLKTRDQDGALIGTHKVAVLSHEGGTGSGPEASIGKLLVPERYINPETSGLTIEVKPDDNNVELKLTSP
jgi:hypothetical protein